MEEEEEEEEEEGSMDGGMDEIGRLQCVEMEERESVCVSVCE